MSPAPLTVLVDARNVLRSTWPNLADDELVALCRRWARKRDVRLVAVFDGSAPEVGDGDALEVVGTGAGESADEWLIRAAADLARGGARYWLVTSDRALRAAAGTHAERIVGGGRFLRELQRV